MPEILNNVKHHTVKVYPEFTLALAESVIQIISKIRDFSNDLSMDEKDDADDAIRAIQIALLPF